MLVLGVRTKLIPTWRECCSEADGDFVHEHCRPERRKCKHCGGEQVKKWYTDAAGDRDYEWVMVDEQRARE